MIRPPNPTHSIDQLRLVFSFQRLYLQAGKTMQKTDVIDILKVNAAPVTALITASNNYSLDDWVKVTTIMAMGISIAYTVWKWYISWRRGKAYETELGE